MLAPLKRVNTRLKEILQEVVSETSGEILELEVRSDHVHVLVEIDPQYGICKLIRIMKGRSSRYLRQEFAWVKSRIPTLWTNSYFVATVGGAPLKAEARVYPESEERLMLVAYTYKLSPSRQQVLVMNKHLEMLRLQYNFRIRERTEAYEQASCPVLGNYCDLKTQAECCPLTCSVSKNALYGDPWTSKGNKRGALAQQDADLPNLKRERPWYKAIQHHVLQQMLRRVENAFGRFFKGEGGYPKPKRRGKYRSWSYPPGDVRFEGNKVRLPGIGWCKFFESRAFPDGFSTRTLTVRKKADGWYLCVQLSDETVPETPTPDAVSTAIGVDLGIRKLASVSTGELIPNPQYGKKAQRRRQLLSRRASRKTKGSARRRKAYSVLARLEQKVERQRTDYHWKVAHQLVNLSDCIIFFERREE